MLPISIDGRNSGHVPPDEAHKYGFGLAKISAIASPGMMLPPVENEQPLSPDA